MANFDKYAPKAVVEQTWFVGFVYAPSVTDSLSDYGKEFSDKRAAWQYVQALRDRAIQTGTFLDLVVSMPAVNYINEPCSLTVYELTVSDGKVTVK